MSRWTTPADLRAQLQRLWDRGRLLAEPELFPLRMPLRGPAAADLGARFDAARAWVQQWIQEEETRGGQGGLQLEWREINSRAIGRNRLPTAVLFDRRDGALAQIGQLKAGRAYDRLYAQLGDAFPVLHSWLPRRALQALALQAQWPRLLAVLHWLRDHPRPGLYLRQLELPGVDTKFIEGHKPVLMELLDRVLDPAAIDADARGVGAFERRYGLRAKPAPIRFRLLDPALYIRGLSDLQIPAEDFARLQLPVDRVFITENEINGLAFPDFPGALVIFGLGYGLDGLKSAAWLADQPIHYWGDIDSHGFAMLDQLRGYFPRARSLLMDRATLLAHQPLWGSEPRPTRRPLPRLGDAEAALYDDLCQERLAPALRLEQERIGFDHLKAALARLAGVGAGA